MAVPGDYTEQEIAFAIIDCGGYLSAIAKTLGCKIESIRNAINSNPELKELVYEQREELLDNAERGLVKAVNAGKLEAIKFVLSRLGRNRGYGQKLEVENTGETSSRIVVYLPDDGRESKPDDDGSTTTTGTAGCSPA